MLRLRHTHALWSYSSKNEIIAKNKSLLIYFLPNRNAHSSFPSLLFLFFFEKNRDAFLRVFFRRYKFKWNELKRNDVHSFYFYFVLLLLLTCWWRCQWWIKTYRKEYINTRFRTSEEQSSLFLMLCFTSLGVLSILKSDRFTRSSSLLLFLILIAWFALFTLIQF